MFAAAIQWEAQSVHMIFNLFGVDPFKKIPQLSKNNLTPNCRLCHTLEDAIVSSFACDFVSPRGEIRERTIAESIGGSRFSCALPFDLSDALQRYSHLHFDLLLNSRTVHSFKVPIEMTSWQIQTLFVSNSLHNNGKILPEFIGYHQLQGIEHFFLSDYNSTDSTKDLAQHYGSGNVTLVDFLQGLPIEITLNYDVLMAMMVQWSVVVVNLGILYLGQFATWIAHWDTDEFVYGATTSLKSFISEMDKKDPGSCMYSLANMIFDYRHHPDAMNASLVIDRHRLRAPHVVLEGKRSKWFGRMHAIKNGGIHQCTCKEGYDYINVPPDTLRINLTAVL